jgi:hypothetical protein
MVLAARGGHGGSRQIGPAASLHGQTGFERRERYRVGHQGRSRPVFDGAMAALLRRVPTAVVRVGTLRDVGTAREAAAYDAEHVGRP